MEIVTHYCTKNEYLNERLKERLDITPEDIRERPLYKVWDTQNEEYIDGVIIERVKNHICSLYQHALTPYGDFDIKCLLPLSRYIVEKWEVR